MTASPRGPEAHPTAHENIAYLRGQHVEFTTLNDGNVIRIERDGIVVEFLPHKNRFRRVKPDLGGKHYGRAYEVLRYIERKRRQYARIQRELATYGSKPSV